MEGVESRLFPYIRARRVDFSSAHASFLSDGVQLPGAHRVISELVANRKYVRGVCLRPGSAGLRVGQVVHDHLRHYYETGRAHAKEHPQATSLRGALERPLGGARVVPELHVATPWCATAADLVARRGDRFFVVEHKTGFNGVFDTTDAGRWRAAVSLAFAGAGIPCTPLGHAIVQGLIGALALNHTFAVPLENISVIVARVWQGPTAKPCTELVALHLADPAVNLAATVLGKHCGRTKRKKDKK